MERFTHFELATDDLEKTADFYRSVFGWKVEKWEGPVDYWMVSSGDETTSGINGGLMPAGGEFRGTINTVEVADIDAVIIKVLENGGSIALEKQAIPAVGYQAYVKDSTGIIIGLHQSDESVPADV